MNIYPYVYRIDHPSGEFYIGYRAANKLPALADFGHIYKTSSKYLSHPFNEYAHTIIAEFYLPSGKIDAYDFEQALIFEHWGNPSLANKSCYYNKARWSNAGREMTLVQKNKIRVKNIGKRHSAETKEKMANSKKGKLRSLDDKKKMSEATLGKPKGPMSDATKDKLRQIHLGKPRSEEVKLKISIAHQRRHNYFSHSTPL